jgi:O-succinylbenzoic acid--CoA ligase
VAVEQMLLEHPAVHEVVVSGVPDPEWGERVVAVVTCTGEPPALDALRDVVQPRSWAPRRVAVVTALPRLANGKVDRVAARRMAADA